MGTIHDLKEFAGGPVGTGRLHGNVLDDEDAYRVLQGWCKNSFARGFKLYKLYVRAAAFSGPPQ